MTKFIAQCAVLAGLFAASLGNYWFTFGLWPRSWSAFFGFFLLSCLLMATQAAISSEK